MLEAAGLGMSYGKSRVLEGVSFLVAPGESLVVVGPSGCGKSTLIRLLCGLEVPEAGSILHQGRSLMRLAPHERGIAVCFQSSALWPHMTLRQNIEAAAPKGSERMAGELMEKLELTRFANQKPSQVSGGQAKRAAIARALAAQRPILLLDEPLASLGGPLAAKTADLINEWARERRQILIWTAHTLDTPLIRFDRSLELSSNSG